MSRRIFPALLFALTACGDNATHSDPPVEMPPDAPDGPPLVDGDLACFADVDTAIDQTIDGHYKYTYNDAGLILREELDRGSDKVVDEISAYTYDGDRLTAFTYDGNADGAPDYREDISYNAAGSESERTVDFDGDGVTDIDEHYDYDASGRLATVRSDNDGDGMIDEIDTQIYAGDQLDHVDLDQDADGTADGVETYHYDATGHLVRIETDEGLDGTLERTQTLEYDARGRLVKQVFVADFQGDGTPDFQFTFTGAFDDRGRLEHSDTDFNGDTERLTYVYLCEVAGRGHATRARLAGPTRAAIGRLRATAARVRSERARPSRRSAAGSARW